MGSGTAPNGECTAKRIAYRIAESAVRAAQYRMIYHHKEEYEVKAMCEFFGVSAGRAIPRSGAHGAHPGSL